MKAKLAILGATILMTACVAKNQPRILELNQTFTTQDIKLVSPQQTITITAEIADTPERRAQGLMNRTMLADGTGMLFIFEDERPRRFWMKNTLIPLDIIFFDAAGNYVSHTSMLPCKTANCPTYPAAGPAKYALEIPYGYIRRVEITGEGLRLEIRD